MSKEVKRTIAHFLNGIAVAVLAAGAIGPAAIGGFSWGTAGIAVTVALVLHATAIRASSTAD